MDVDKAVCRKVFLPSLGILGLGKEKNTENRKEVQNPNFKRLHSLDIIFRKAYELSVRSHGGVRLANLRVKYRNLHFRGDDLLQSVKFT